MLIASAKLPPATTQLGVGTSGQELRPEAPSLRRLGRVYRMLSPPSLPPRPASGPPSCHGPAFSTRLGSGADLYPRHVQSSVQVASPSALADSRVSKRAPRSSSALSRR